MTTVHFATIIVKTATIWSANQDNLIQLLVLNLQCLGGAWCFSGGAASPENETLISKWASEVCHHGHKNAAYSNRHTCMVYTLYACCFLVFQTVYIFQSSL